MIDDDLCIFLEYHLGEAFANSDKEEVRSFWCDGVLLSEPDKCYSKKFINDNRQTTLKAFIGKDGGTAYELILKFGRRALSRFARDLDISICVPDAEKPDWFNIDTKNRKIEIQLD
jgi:hypothetical protein